MIQFIINVRNDIKDGLDRLKAEAPRIYSALKTGAAAFAAQLLPVFAIFMADVYRWADDQGDFPVGEPLLKAAVAGALGFVAAIVNYLWNGRENASQPVYVKE